MRKVILFNLISLDGFFEGPNRDINWHNVDAEFNAFAEEQLKTVEALLFGRVTYELMAAYWPTPAALTDDPIIATAMNSVPKFVFSTTLQKADWENTTLVKGNAAQEVAKLKQQPGKDMFIFGSSDLAVSLMPLDLIDEYRLIVNPLILGDGKRMFEGLDEMYKLELLKSRTFKNGNVLLYHQPHA